MKKKILLLITYSFLITYIALAQSDKNSELITVDLTIKRGGTAPNCREFGICQASSSIMNNDIKAERSITNRSTMLLNSTGSLVQKIWKENLDEDLRSDFLGQNTYYVPQETTINPEIQSALKSAELLIILKGWHPIIELEDCFVISYTLKK